MNITAEGIAASTSLVELTLKKQEIRHLLDRLLHSDTQERRQELQRELERLVEDVRLCVVRES